MDLTVKDCLSMASFSKAKVVGGKKGLSRPVRSCTVLEWSDNVLPSVNSKNSGLQHWFCFILELSCLM